MAEDDCWVFDSLVCFLNGPVWNAPLQSFIEERSLIFEPNGNEYGEYRKTYEDFKNLVDFMLGNFMEDIGITPQQFEQACYRGAKEGVPLQFDQNTFEQIWAANDYEMFKRMMTQRNVELQLQALELIERKFGKTPESFIPEKRNAQGGSGSKTTAEISPMPMVKSSELEREILVEVSKQFAIEETEQEDTKEDEMKYIQEEKINLEETLKKTIDSQAYTSPLQINKEEKLSTQRQILEKPTEEEDDEEESKEVIEEEKPVEQEKPDMTRIAIDRPQNTQVGDIELKKRQEYLRAQRDKLVALKKEARKKHLDTDIVSNTERARARPKSARAAESILSGGKSVVEPERMKLRKALVERLKSEVIQHKE